MHRKFLGLFIVIAALVCMGCKSPVADTPATETPAPASDKAITLLAITGVVAPVRGATPVTTITETAQYTGTITWSGSPATFTASTPYTATIALTAKAGWTLNGVAVNSFTVAGATTVTNAVNSGTVAAVFPATFAAPILTMVTVPAGSFQRDSTSTNISTISAAFRMSEKEITRAQFAAVMGSDPSNETYSGGTTDPVQKTNWYHAIAFCNKLSIKEGLSPVYTVTGVDFNSLTFAAIPTVVDFTWNAATANWTNTGYRLPTEMEWMWAAMGASGSGTNTTGYLKAFAGSTGSNAIGNYAVFGYGLGQIGATTTQRSNPVGSKTTGANELGLYDMSGNVSEWTWDWYAAAYPTGAQTDYRGAASGTDRVVRGGSWGNGALGCTVANRGYCYLCNQNNDIGFRVVCP